MIQTIKEMTRERKGYLIAICLLWIIYAALTIGAPLSQTSARYGINLGMANLLRVTILIPYLFIWLSGVIAIFHFRKYIRSIVKSEEEEGFKNILIGIFLLLGTVIVPPFIGLYSNYNPGVFEVQKIVTILRNNATVLLYLTSFYYFWKGSGYLLKTLGDVNKVKLSYLYPLGTITLLGITYIYIVLNNDYRSVSDSPIIRPTYYLEDVPIFITVVIPYILTWLLGLLAILNIQSLKNSVEGVIYKKSFNFLSQGLTLVITLAISLQFLSQATVALSNANLQIVLLLVYAILFSLSVSYWLLARGAKSLSAIEKI